MPGPFFSLAQTGLLGSPTQLLASWLTAMQVEFPGYQPSAGNLEYIHAQIMSSWAADLANLASSGSVELFRQYGLQLLNLPYEAGTGSIVTINVGAVDTVGYTLPYGTQLTLNLGGTDIPFQTAGILTIPPGSSSGTVTAIAMQVGSAFNGAGNPASLVTQIDWVSTVTAAAPSGGGLDQETDDAYLNRLAAQLQLLSPTPITATDYAQTALSFVPAPNTAQQEVGRSVAIDGYEPPAGSGTILGSGAGANPNTYNNEREVTVCIADANGNALNTTDTLPAVQAFLTSLREVNFIVNVSLANYTTVYVKATVKALPNANVAGVQAAVQGALLSYLSPGGFGLPSDAPTGWLNSPYVYLSTVESTIQASPGVQAVIAGTLAVDTVSPPSNTTADLLLPGPFPLPMSSVASIPLSAITVV